MTVFRLNRCIGTAAAVALVALFAGCGAGRQVQTEPSDSSVFGSGKSVTLVKVADRTMAGVAAGPMLGGNQRLSTDSFPGKVIVINIWGSWCSPCRKEAPDLAAASKTTAKTAQFIGVDIRDDSASAQAFVRAFKIPYPSIEDPDAAQLVKLSPDLPIIGVPTTLLVDPKGRTAARIVGPITRSSLIDMINDVAAGK